MKLSILSKAQMNILEAIYDQTIISKGPNKGSVKKRISIVCYDGRSIDALIRRDLIEYGEGVSGIGFSVTKLGIQALENAMQRKVKK